MVGSFDFCDWLLEEQMLGDLGVGSSDGSNELVWVLWSFFGILNGRVWSLVEKKILINYENF
jgi:hypothetical protein